MQMTEQLELVRRISVLEKEVKELHAVEGPLPRIGFLAYMSADQLNVATGVQIPVEFDLTRFNYADAFDTATYTFTAPFPGIYLFVLNLRLDNVDSAATLITTWVATTRRNYAQVFPPVGLDQDVDGFGTSVSCIANMGATQTASANIQVAGGAAQMDITEGAISKFSGWLIG